MARITKEIKAIADAHLQARLSGQWDNPVVKTKEEVLALLREGKTFEAVLEQIEIKFASVGSILLNRTFDHTSTNYKSAIYKGFKTLLQ